MRILLKISTYLFIFSLSNLIGQNKEIILINPSFEDVPACCNPPEGWIDCGYRTETPPDIQPALDHSGVPLFGCNNQSNIWQNLSCNGR